ncbi:hypothetical protein ABBQ32_004967 [Trebouxia sp. C0010 RCD-2024]
MGGIKKKKAKRGIEHHKRSLEETLEAPETYGVRTKTRPAKRRKAAASAAADEAAENEEALSEALSHKVMREARAQQEELDAEDQPEGAIAQAGHQAAATAVDSDSEQEDFDKYSELDAFDTEEVEVSPDDEQALAAFMAPHAGGFQQRTLADLILQKIQDKERGQGQPSTSGQNGAAVIPPGLDPKVVEVYHAVGKIMSRFTAGKVPKAFKVIPNLQNWEEILFLTDPEQWSPHAVYQATRLFISNLNAKMAQRFLALVLLPHVRQDIEENKRCHFALFQAMKKATYKPDAFFKGLLLPLCQSGDCNLREAVIVSSVLKRVSLPVLHSAAALLRIADMAYSGTNSFFIRVLLDKKYALPYRVIDGLVDHFTQFQREERVLPVVWHQALLCFIQRYKHEIRKEDKEALRKLIKVQYHYQVSPEITRELDASRSRGEKDTGAAAMEVQSRVGKNIVEDPRDLPPVILMDEDEDM